MTTLPTGWTLAPLGDLGRYQNGRAFSEREWAEEGRPIIRIQNLTGSGKSFNFFAGDADEKHVVRNGDLLVSWAATLGVYVWHGPEAVLNQHIFKVESDIDPGYHRYALEWALDAMRRSAHGSGMVHITKGKFDAVEVPLAPLAEQARIAADLARRLSHIDAASRGLENALGRLAQARSSVEYETFWAPGHRRSRLADLVVEKLANGRSVKDRPGGFPVLRLTCLRGGRIDLSQYKAGDWAREDAEKYLVRAGDFLVSRGNGSLRLVARGGLVPAAPSLVAYPDTLIRVRIDPEQMLPDYLAAVWESQGVRRQIESVARTTAGIYKVNQGHLAAIELPVPTVEEQAQAISELSRRMSLIEVAEGAIVASQLKTEQLRRSLVGAAFAGRLLPQDPKDEAADHLLADIRSAANNHAQRTATARPRKNKKKEDAA